MKYRRSLAGKPYVKDPPFTRGFVPGVGYMKNMMRATPAIFITCVITGISACILGGRAYYDSLRDPEERWQYKPRYTIKRSDEVSDPSKPVFN